MKKQPDLTYVGHNLLSHLEHDQEVEVRTGRYVQGKDEPDWSDWRKERLHIQRRPNGEIACLSLQGSDWAEYDCHCYEEPHSMHPYGVFLVEDYYMEIKLTKD